MYNVLHIMAGADAGGISTVVLNYYRVLDKEKIHFDIAVTTNMIGLNAAEMEKLGAKIYKLPLKSKGIKAFEVALVDLLVKGDYLAVHVHENETSYVALRIAKKVGIPQRIAHAHTSSPYVSIKSEIRRLSGCVLNYYYATNVIACGQLAGDRVFGKWNMKRGKACVLPNAIDETKFKFDAEIRKATRKELNVEDKFVVGMIGRLSPEKNLQLAFDIIDHYSRNNSNVVLLCAGNGELEEELKTEIRVRKLEKYICLLGRRSDVNRLYMAFDVLLMPSIHEGFPIAPVEAIASGLPVLLSSNITGEFRDCANVFYLPINNESTWIEKLNYLEHNTVCNREVGQQIIKSNGLDIAQTAKQLEDIYLDFGKRETLC